MATVLDTGLLSHFLPIFVFIFIFSALLALLEKTKLFGENQKTLNVAAALSIAAISLFTGNFVGLIAIVTPWVVFLFVVLFLVFALFGFFDISKEKTWDLFGHTPILVLVLIIVIVGISVVFDSTLSPYQVASPEAIAVAATASGTSPAIIADQKTNVREQTLRTLTNPRILGALFTLLVAAAAVRYLGDVYDTPGKPK